VRSIEVRLLPETFSVCGLASNSPIPSQVLGSSCLSITRTADELSIVCEQSLAPLNAKIEKDWRAFKVLGKLDFVLTGILASIANPLAQAKISIFAISSFDTDYVLVREMDIVAAETVLIESGIKVAKKLLR
jgi:uncharacterized protein